MTLKIRKLPNRDLYKVYDSETGVVYHSALGLSEAEDLMNEIYAERQKALDKIYDRIASKRSKELERLRALGITFTKRFYYDIMLSRLLAPRVKTWTIDKELARHNKAYLNLFLESTEVDPNRKYQDLMAYYWDLDKKYYYSEDQETV